ncbi:hypothetical protein M0805_005969 [Coniferiporia weirii]|nr:hypothetical protein M0805_005969 [Coniferiporia weirii]
MFALYSVPRLMAGSSRWALRTGLTSGPYYSMAIGAPSRGFRSSACLKAQYFDAEADTMMQVLTDSKAQNRVVLVDFYASWCQPCKMISPILEKLTAPENEELEKTGSGRKLDLITIDADTQSELLATFNVRSLPTVIAFKDGQPENKFVGAQNEQQIRAFLANL